MTRCIDCGGEKDWYERVYMKITYECNLCKHQYEDSKEYWQNFYVNDRYRKSGDLHPEPDWFCPFHPDEPNYNKILLCEEIRKEKRTDDTEPYEREDDPGVLEDIEMEGEICYCGHEWDCHFPPWGAKELARTCRFDTCTCERFQLMEIDDDS